MCRYLQKNRRDIQNKTVRGLITMSTVATEMIKYYAGDKKRINHFIKVHGYAKAIGEAEELDERTMLILETAAYVHDIGIKISEEKYNSSAGKYQEIESLADCGGNAYEIGI